jgi:hypothetical protein
MSHRPRFLVTILALATTLFIAAPAQADRRIFGYVYPYQTLPKGGMELEHYLDLGLAAWDNPATTEVEKDWSRAKWKHQVEVEYGITDRLDFGFYNVFSQSPYGTMKYDGAKLRSRYRFGEVGQYPVDLAIYGELQYMGSYAKAEQMIILGKRIGRLELSFNLRGEQEFAFSDQEWVYELLPLAGVGFHVLPFLALSLEYMGKVEFEAGEREVVNYLGPSISVAGRNFYWTLAVQPQLGNEEGQPRIQIRSLFGITL